MLSTIKNPFFGRHIPRKAQNGMGAMNKKNILLVVFMLFLNARCLSQEKEKVILDTDMVELFDDGIAMMMLAKAPHIDLIGVTTVVGNTWVSEGTAFAIRQLEAIGRTDIPVVQGIRAPLSPNRFENIKKECLLFGSGNTYIGAASRPEPKSWEEVYRSCYGADPMTKPLDMKAVNFMIEQVKANPGEISILAIGPCVNLAVAVRMAPEIVPLIKRVVYMGGAFFKSGNASPTAEFNWWIDPDAAKICIRTPFPEQIVVSLDVCEKITFDKRRYDPIARITNNTEISRMMKRSFLNRLFRDEPTHRHFVWDVVAAAILIDPTLIREEVTRHIDVNSQFGSSYGQSLAFDGNPPSGSRQARIILTIDENKLWSIVEKYCAEF